MFNPPTSSHWVQDKIQTSFSYQSLEPECDVLSTVTSGSLSRTLLPWGLCVPFSLPENLVHLDKPIAYLDKPIV